ncbi:MAG TPA: iron-sulfur cluster assembly protein, partial [Candidatus Deferrimicrobium sp.]|nr:iron-sulfur cluster assembly protein [Candidatus Deferrimicrobium sp.]
AGRALGPARRRPDVVIGPMTDTTTDPNAAPAAPAPTAEPGPAAFDTSADGAPFDPQRRATELAILDALRAVVDPEIGMNVVELALIKQIILGPDSTEVKMILTTPFCPYAGSMIQQVKDQAESVVEHDVKVTLLAERWDPRDAGLMW